MRVGPQRERLLDAHRVVADDLHLRPQLAEVLDEVEGERVVVVDEEDHALALPPASSASNERAGLGLRLSLPRRRVGVGDDAGARLERGRAGLRGRAVRMAMQMSRLPRRSR